jgi:hypothetical protein
MMTSRAGRWPETSWVAVLGLALWGSGAAAAAPLPDRFTATFAVEAIGVALGETRWDLSPEPGGRFRLTSVTQPTGAAALVLDSSRREESLWEYADGRPRPLHYAFERTGTKARSDRIAFDWSRGVATSTSRGRSWSLPLAPGTLDGLVYILALMQDLAAGREVLSYTFAERGKVKTYRLGRDGPEVVATAVGRLETLRLSRTDERGRRTVLWCAPALGYLPVQIEHTEEDGKPITLRLKAVEGIPPGA